MRSVMTSKIRCIAVAIYASASIPALAQPQFTLLPNPLVKPAARSIPVKEAKDGGKGSSDAKPQGPGALPIAQRIEAGSFPPGPSPLLGSPNEAFSAKAGVAGEEPARGVQDALAQYTVTAVLDNWAVLRTLVGNPGSQSTQAGTSQHANQPGGGAGSADARSAQARQLVLRVRSGQPITVAGVSVIPTVTPTRVDFALAGSRVVLFSAVLESLSPANYALTPTLKEAADAGTAARVMPMHTGASNGAGQGGANGVGAAGFGVPGASSGQR